MGPAGSSGVVYRLLGVESFRVWCSGCLFVVLLAILTSSPSPIVHILGQILGATGFKRHRLFGKWKIEGSDKWRLLDGEQDGQTWVAEKREVGVYT